MVLMLSDNLVMLFCSFFFCKQKTAYEMRISDWSSDVCSSDLRHEAHRGVAVPGENDLVPRLGAPDQFRQLPLGLGYRHAHGTFQRGQNRVFGPFTGPEQLRCRAARAISAPHCRMDDRITVTICFPCRPTGAVVGHRQETDIPAQPPRAPAPRCRVFPGPVGAEAR